MNKCKTVFLFCFALFVELTFCQAQITGSIADGYCGQTLETEIDLIRCVEVADAVKYRWRFTDVEDPAIILERETSDNKDHFRPTWIKKIVLGHTYSVQVMPVFADGILGQFGDACEVTLAQGPPPSASLENDIVLACFDDDIYCNQVTQAMVYEWKISDDENTYIHRTYYQGSNHFKMSDVEGVEFDKSYSVQVRVEIGSTFSPWGEAHTVVTPPENGTGVSIGGHVLDKYANVVLPELTSLIRCQPIAGAKNYVWEMTDAEDPSIKFTRETSEGACYYRPTWEKNAVLGHSYLVRVKPKFYCGGEGIFGDPCKITLASVPVPTTSLGQDVQLACMDQDVYCNFVTQAMIYEWVISDGQNTTTHRTYYHKSNHMKLSDIDGIQYNTDYQVKVRVQIGSVFGEFGESYTVTTPEDELSTIVNISTEVKPEFCGIVLESNLSTIKLREIPYAGYYVWELTDIEDPAQVYTRTGSPGNSFLRPTWIKEVVLGKSYLVRVKPIFECGREGVYGEPCTITLANEEIPTTSIGQDLVLSSLDESITCAKVTQAMVYEWNITNADTTIVYSTYFQSSNSIKFSEIPGIKAGETYCIKIRTEIGSTMSDYGDEYCVTTPAVQPIAAGQTIPVLFDVYPSTVDDAFTIAAQGDVSSFSYSVQAINGTQPVLQQAVENSSITVDASSLLSGMYVVTIDSGNQQTSITIYKQ